MASWSMDTAYIHSAGLALNSHRAFLVSALAVLALVYFLLLAAYRLFLSPLRSVPGPWYAAVSDLWLISHVLRLRRCRAVDDMLKKYGPIVRVAPNKVIFLDASSAKLVYGTSSRLSKSIFYKCLLTNENNHAMTILDHTSHTACKRGYAPHYTPANLALFQPEMHEFTLELIHHLATTRLGVAHDTLALFRHLMVDVNCAHLFGCRAGSLSTWAHADSQDADPLSAAISDFPKRGLLRSALPGWLWTLLTHIPNARWRLLCDSDKAIAEFVSSQVHWIRHQLQTGKERFVHGEKASMAARLLRHRIAPPNDLAPVDDIISEGMGHLIAGSDTTSTTLSYIFWELSRRPDIALRLQAELDHYIPDPRYVPDIQVLQDLPYLGALIKEGLRIYSSAPSPLERVVPPTAHSSSFTASPFNLLGHILPQDTIVATQAWSSHRLPQVFPDPDFFNPDRWLSAKVQTAPLPALSTTTPPGTPSRPPGANTKSGSPTTLAANAEKAAGGSVGPSAMQAHMFPFGVGARVCGGQNVAQMMLRIVIAALARNFNVRAPAETNEQSMAIKDSFVIFPAAMQCKLIFVPRKQ